MVPEIWRATERIFVILDHFCPFTSLTIQKIKILKKMKKMPEHIIILHKCNKNHDHMLYCSRDMVHDGCNFYFSFYAFCLPFYPPNILKNHDLEKVKKNAEYIIILHMRTKNYDQMMYSS